MRVLRFEQRATHAIAFYWCAFSFEQLFVDALTCVVERSAVVCTFGQSLTPGWMCWV